MLFCACSWKHLPFLRNVFSVLNFNNLTLCTMLVSMPPMSKFFNKTNSRQKAYHSHSSKNHIIG